MADRAWPTSASTPFIRSRYDPLVKGVDLGRDENYRSNEKTIIYIHVSFFKIIFTKRLYWILSLILLRQQNYIKFPRDYFRIICCDLGEGFPKKKMKRGERIGYDKSVNLIRGTRSWGDWRVLVVEARRVWTELERVHAPRRRERGETRARDAGRVWWTWFVCIPRPWGGRQSSMEIIVAHGARCPSSTDLSLFPVQLIPVPSPFLRVYEASKETRIEVEKEKRMIYRYNRPL